MSIILTTAGLLLVTAVSFIKGIYSEKLVRKVLFKDGLNQYHKTKFFFQKLVARYELSIKTVNRTFILNVAILPFVLYPLLAYTSDANFKVPLIDFEIKNSLWIQIAPAITLTMQLFFLTALIWFQILRKGIYILLLEYKNMSDDIGDIRNISLNGIIGIFHLLFSIRNNYKSKFHLIWYLPFYILALGISLTPIVLSGFLIFTVFNKGYLVLGIFYLIFSLPVSILVILLISVFLMVFVQDKFSIITSNN